MDEFGSARFSLERVLFSFLRSFLLLRIALFPSFARDGKKLNAKATIREPSKARKRDNRKVLPFAFSLFFFSLCRTKQN